MKIKDIVIILSVCTLLVAACTSQSTEPTPTPTPTPDIQILTENLSCHEILMDPFNCECYLTGAVKNFGDKDAVIVSVKAEFFDDIGTKIGDGTASVAGTSLSAGASDSYSMNIKVAECPSTYEVWAEWREAGEGCFIATAAYGTSTTEEIDTLRAFRDNVLLQNSLGSQLVDLYYKFSPPVADFISEHAPLRALTRELLIEPTAWLFTATESLWQD